MLKSKIKPLQNLELEETALKKKVPMALRSTVVGPGTNLTVGAKRPSQGEFFVSVQPI